MMQKKFMSKANDRGNQWPGWNKADRAEVLTHPTHGQAQQAQQGRHDASVKKMCAGSCHESTVGTYGETQEDFWTSLTNNAKGETRKRFFSGIKEDALLQAVDPNYQAQTPDSGAGQVGFAPQSRVGSIGGGYTQQDIQDLPVLGENKKYPSLDQYKAKKSAKSKRR